MIETGTCSLHACPPSMILAFPLLVNGRLLGLMSLKKENNNVGRKQK